MAKQQPPSAPPTTPGRDWRGVAQLALVLLFLITLAGGIALLVRRSAPSGVEITLPPAAPANTVTVHVAGAVTNPGVYTLPEGARLQGAIEAAGGLTLEADTGRVNLAGRLRDGDQYVVPRLGEAAAQTANAVAASANGLLNINVASVEQLVALPGIDQVRAKAIVAYRQEHGPFRRHEDLLEVPGIGLKTLEGLRPLITVE